MPELAQHLILSRCSHCGVDQPSLNKVSHFLTGDYKGQNERMWHTFSCTRCGGVITAWAYKGSINIVEMYPEPMDVDDALPERAKEYLNQAINSISAPAGAVMLAASSVDAMLKEKNLTTGNLYSRIEKAVEEHLITPEMGQWAHSVRLDANEQRHADNDADLPNESDAKKVIDFAQALGTFLFVLPSRVNRGIQNAENS